MTSGPSGPSAPSGGGPKTGAPSSGRSGVATAGLDLSQDLSTWETWWEFNKFSYLDLRRSVLDPGPQSGDPDSPLGLDRLRPTSEDLREKAVPALLSVLDQAKNPDLVSGALVAVGKIGADPRLSAAVVGRLGHPNQEIVETAALCLGLLRDLRALPTLLALAQDQPFGRSFVGKESIPTRTRAFAIYGLGLFAARTPDERTCRQIVEALRALRVRDSADLEVARVLALGLARDGEKLAAEELRRILQDPSADVRVRAQAPISLARLLAPRPGEDVHPLLAPVHSDLLALLGDPSQPELVRASCAQALPSTARAASEREAAVQALIRAASAGRSQAERQFALLSLGRLGGASAEDHLRKHLAKSGPLRPWASLAMGLLARAEPQAAVRVVPALREALQGERNLSYAGAHAVALGLARDEQGAGLLLERMRESKFEDFQGYCAVALGLLRARHAIPDVERLARAAFRRPELQQQAVIGLGLLGDKQVALDLTQLLREARTLSAQAALATSIGWIGDRRTLDPLIGLLETPSLTPLARAFVAVALGMVGDPDALPWTSRLSADLNYLAAPATLLDRTTYSGVLDIL